MRRRSRSKSTSDIPMAAGLGSSAAATVAGLRIFERVTEPVDDATLLGVATALEGHADNAAPALFGGLNSVLQIGARRSGGHAMDVARRGPRDRGDTGRRSRHGEGASGACPITSRAPTRFSTSSVCCRWCTRCSIASTTACAKRSTTAGTSRLARRWCRCSARCSRSRTLMCSARSCPAPVHRWRCWPDGTSRRVEQLLASLYARAGVDATVRTLDVHQGRRQCAGR